MPTWLSFEFPTWRATRARWAARYLAVLVTLLYSYGVTVSAPVPISLSQQSSASSVSTAAGDGEVAVSGSGCTGSVNVRLVSGTTVVSERELPAADGARWSTTLPSGGTPGHVETSCRSHG